MDLILLFCVLLLPLLVISLLHYSPFLKTSTINNVRLPPGKTGWPVIGESIEFLTNLKKCDSEKFFFNRMAKYSPDVFKTSVFGDHVAVLCGAAGSKFMFSNTNKLVKRWLVRPAKMILFSDDLLISTDQFLKPAFVDFIKADGLRNFIGVMDTVAQRHLESFWHGKVVAYPLVNSYAFALACRFFLSIEDPEVVGELFEPMETLALGIQSLPINLPGTGMNRALKARDVLSLKIQKIVRHQRSKEQSCSSSSSSSKNLLSYILQVYDHQNDHLVADSILGLLFGGHETITSVLCMTIKVLADRPDIYRRVYQENMEVAAKKMPGEELTMEDTHNMRYTWNVAREVMRLYPPAPFITREAMSDFTYAGYHIPKGYKIITSVIATHKDPKNFPEPEIFDPSRFEGEGPLPYTYIPFGGGALFCSGNKYAQLVIQVFIHNAVKRFKWEALIPDEKITGIPLPRPARGLPLLLHSHAH